MRTRALRVDSCAMQDHVHPGTQTRGRSSYFNFRGKEKCMNLISHPDSSCLLPRYLSLQHVLHEDIKSERHVLISPDVGTENREREVVLGPQDLPE